MTLRAVLSAMKFFSTYLEKIPSTLKLYQKEGQLNRPQDHILILSLVIGYSFINHGTKIITGADPGGGGPALLTLGFEAPKLSIFGPHLIFP